MLSVVGGFVVVSKLVVMGVVVFIIAFVVTLNVDGGSVTFAVDVHVVVFSPDENRSVSSVESKLHERSSLTSVSSSSSNNPGSGFVEPPNVEKSGNDDSGLNKSVVGGGVEVNDNLPLRIVVRDCTALLGAGVGLV